MPLLYSQNGYYIRPIKDYYTRSLALSLTGSCNKINNIMSSCLINCYCIMIMQCDRNTALQAVHTELLQPPTKIGIIGSGCSVATEPSAEVSRYYNLTHVSIIYCFIIMLYRYMSSHRLI